MKKEKIVIGIGKDNLGFHPVFGKIEKGKEYKLPFDFDFEKSDLFEEKKEAK